MPQFDQVESFAGQIFWLAVSFSLLYFLLARFVLPQLGATIAGRASRIAADLARARALRTEIDAAQLAYEQALTRARDEARALTQRAQAEAKALETRRMAEITAEIAAATDAATARIAAARADADAAIRAAAADLAGTLVARVTGTPPDPSEIARRLEATR